MTMQDMVDYLKTKGYKVDKRYLHETIEYEFHIEKNGNHLVSRFKYPEGAKDHIKNLKQEEFLDNILKEFNTKFCKDTNLKAEIKDVIFNDPATIVFWTDGTKTVVKAQNDDTFDPEKGLAIAIAKKAFGNKGNYCNKLKKWLPEEKKPVAPVTVEFDGGELKQSLVRADKKIKKHCVPIFKKI